MGPKIVVVFHGLMLWYFAMLMKVSSCHMPTATGDRPTRGGVWKPCPRSRTPTFSWTYPLVEVDLTGSHSRL
jgi:hypothetical protein